MIGLRFNIEKVGNFDLKLKATDIFDDSHPLIATYQYENDDALFLFNWRREHVPFFMKSNGIIEFKNSNHQFPSILFGISDAEMHFLGMIGEKVQAQNEAFRNLGRFLIITMVPLGLLAASQ